MKLPVVGDILTNQQAMSLAISEARKGFGYVAPNPPVGCVILDRENRFLGSGFHRKCGGPHAEVEALESISDQSRLQGAQVFVTLEPCSHHGKTPPCAEALARLPIAKVIFGIEDPNPQVAGRGAQFVANAGIQIEKWQGPECLELIELIEVFLCNTLEKRAFVALKAATTLDGQLAEKSGHSKWITGSEAREEVHALRAHYDGILVGRGTVEVDDPSLDIRTKKYPQKTNKVFILDPKNGLGKKMTGLALFKSHDSKSVFQLIGSDASQDKDVAWNQLVLPVDNEGGFNLNDLSSQLLKLGVHSLLVEGGAEVFARFLGSSSADRLYLFVAPKILGQGAGLSWTGSFSGKSLKNCPSLSSRRVKTFGEDILITGRLSPVALPVK